MTNTLKSGDRFIVIKPPEGISLLNGGQRGVFHNGEEVVFDYYTYNSYDGFPMFFFKPRADGSEVVWIGRYDDSQESMLQRWTEHFRVSE